MDDYDDAIAVLLDSMSTAADGLDELDYRLTELADSFAEMALTASARVEAGQFRLLSHRTRALAKQAGDDAEETRERVTATEAQIEASRWREVKGQLYEVLDEQMRELLEP